MTRIETLAERINRLNRLAMSRDRDNVHRLAEYYRRLDEWMRTKKPPPIQVIRG